MGLLDGFAVGGRIGGKKAQVIRSENHETGMIFLLPEES